VLLLAALLKAANAYSGSPNVATLPANNVTCFGATLNGQVYTGGQAATAYFQYGLTANYGNRVGQTVFASSAAPFPGPAVSFDGSTQNATVPGFGNYAPTNEITIEFWQNVAVVQQQSAFILDQDLAANRLNSHTPWADGNIYWDVGNIAGAGRLFYLPPTPLTGVWNHFALVASQSANSMAIYRNGVLEAQKSGMSPFQRYDADLLLGGGTAENLYFNGALAEFRVWNKALNPQTIQAWMNQPLTNIHPDWTNLVAYWPMNEGSGALLHDLSGNGHNATLNNSPVWLTRTNFPIAAPVQGLAPHTTYHYSLAVNTTAGTVVGQDATFTTPAAANLNSSLPLTVLHHFTAGADGEIPVCTPLVSGGRLYGTTSQGNGLIFGSVFAVNLDGTGFTNLHTFGTDPLGNEVLTDGNHPETGLVLSGDILYGTTGSGGSNGYGTLFSVNTDGSGFTNFYNFTGGYDGGDPTAPLLLSGNTLYGGTFNGGTNGTGTIFAIHTDGSGFTVLRDISAFTDGRQPVGALLLSGDTLYGAMSVNGGGANGTIFSLKTNGSNFSVLHTFSYNPNGTNNDGASPLGGLALSANRLYGTAGYAATHNGGNVFALNTDGSGFTNLYNFTGGADGYQPDGLVLVGRTLYITLGGGGYGQGALFRLNTDGTCPVAVHDFTPLATDSLGQPTNSDGWVPSTAPTLAGHTLYGTAQYGGAFNQGTVFSLPLGPALSLARSGPNVAISWPADFAGFSLQYATNLAQPQPWPPASPLPALTDGRFAVTNTADRIRFYRLTQ